MRFDVFKAYLKYKLGLTVGLPAFVINSVKECDNGESLVDIRKAKAKLFFGGRLTNEKEVFLRCTVADKIIKATRFLPDGICFIIYDAYRPLSVQQKTWNEKYAYFKKKYPDETDDQITLRTKRVVADPRHGHGGHQTGGAIDIGLCDENGVELDMGVIYLGQGKSIRTNAEVNQTARSNRNLLCKIMKKSGFVNYPNEWWHFCYGDRMWAAYLGKRKCFYGLVK